MLFSVALYFWVAHFNDFSREHGHDSPGNFLNAGREAEGCNPADAWPTARWRFSGDDRNLGEALVQFDRAIASYNPATSSLSGDSAQDIRIAAHFVIVFMDPLCSYSPKPAC